MAPNVYTLVLYEDGEVETIDLTDETFQIEETAFPKGSANGNKKRKSKEEGGDVHDSSTIANIPRPKS